MKAMKKVYGKPGDFERLYAQKEIIGGTPHGEVVACIGPHIYIHNAMPVKRKPFRAAVGIYKGFLNNFSRNLLDEKGDLKELKGITLAPEKQVSLGIIEVTGVDTGLIMDECSHALMCLHENNEFFIGPEEVARAMKVKGGGHFDGFIESYIKENRDV